ncbi:hypothetical protein HK100_007687, partial [Physocladia obscura]
MDKRSIKKQRALALTQDVRVLWANQSRTQSGASHQNNNTQALTDDTQPAYLVPSSYSNTIHARRAILPGLSRDPDMDDYPFVPAQSRVIELEFDWSLDEDSGDDAVLDDLSDDELYEEYYSQTPVPETGMDEDVVPVVSVPATVD